MHKHGGDMYGREDFLDFSANINPFGIPKSVVEAAVKGVYESTAYPDVDCRRLRDDLSKELGVRPDNIICGNGAADVIFALSMGLKPKKAIMPAPTFYEYEQALRGAGCEIEFYYLDCEAGFKFDDRLLNQIDENVDIVFICNPNNPTGALCDREYLIRVLDKCRECGAVLVVDECFNEFVDEGENVSVLGLVSEYDNLFILKAFTKIYAMPGLRLGYGVCGNPEIMKNLKEVLQPWNVSMPAQMAGIAALKEKEFVEKTQDFIKSEREFLYQGLVKLGFQVYKPSANYIFFKACKGLHLQCLEEKIMIRDCSNYEGLEDGFYRVAVKSREDNLKLLETLGRIGGK